MRPTGRTLRAAAAALVAGSVLTACGTGDTPGDGPAAISHTEDKDGLYGTAVEPPLRLAPASFKDTRGKPVRLDRLPANQATALFLGYTHCNDICPTTMADLAAARRMLPVEAANRVAIYFLTVDPQRDTSTVLRKWLNHFDPDIVGLRGSTDRVSTVERSLYAAESHPTRWRGKHQAGEEHGGPTDDGAHADYEVNHSGSVYVFGPHGETVLYTGGTTVKQYAADFKELLNR